MARLPYVDLADLPVNLREELEELPPLNIFRVTAHAQSAVRPLLLLGAALLGDGAVDARLRELAILRVASVTGAEYEWVQHAAIAHAVGVTDGQLLAVERGELTASCFDETERLVLRFAAEVLELDGATEATTAELAGMLSYREVIELTITIGYYRMLAAVMNTSGIDLDEARGVEVIAAARERSGQHANDH